MTESAWCPSMMLLRAPKSSEIVLAVRPYILLIVKHIVLENDLRPPYSASKTLLLDIFKAQSPVSESSLWGTARLNTFRDLRLYC